MRRELQGRKGYQSSAMLIATVVFIVMIFLGAIFMASFGAKAQDVSLGTVTGSRCKWSLDMKAMWNKNAKEGVHDASAWSGGIASSVAGTIGAAPGLVFGGLVGLAIHPALAVPGAMLGGWGGSAIGGYMAEAMIENMADVAADIATVKTDLCIANTRVTCEGPADYVATCIYGPTSQTFYSLRGGLSDSKIEDEDGDPFIMFKIYVNVTQPGKIATPVHCGDLASWASPSRTTPLYEGDFTLTPVNGDFENGKCNVTINEITSDTISLSMLLRCVEHGLDNLLFCKCFAREEIGYNLGNGLPTGDFGEVVFAEYGPYDTRFRGCGSDSTNTYTFPGTGTRVIVGDATLYTDSILVTPHNLVIGVGTEELLYTRLSNDGTRVVLSSSPW